MTPVRVLQRRRRDLATRLSGPALLAAGAPIARNYPQNPYRFRASSHFLYFAHAPLEHAYLWIEGDRTTLFAVPPDEDDALWHGPTPSFADLAERGGYDEVLPLDEAPSRLAAERDRIAVLPPQDAATAAELSRWLARPVGAGSGAELAEERDAALAEAVIALRLVHDDFARTCLREAAAVSARAHARGMAVTAPGKTEAHVVGAIVGVLRAEGYDDAYPPIVTTHGEVLHNHAHHHTMRDGDLLLVDAGGEHPLGWASDITRTWPVSGRFSATQRAVYDVVLEAQARAIDKARVGVRYREVHEAAKRSLVEGLVQLGILKGSVDGLLERGAAAMFFPHGVGHLLGLDVHDMEDLGDRAGYAPGRERSRAFGDAFLRLDRDLEAGMAVTIEPGFYQVDALVERGEIAGRIGTDLDRGRLAAFRDVRGIRIEDDVLITEQGPLVLSDGIAKTASEVEALVGAG